MNIFTGLYTAQANGSGISEGLEQVMSSNQQLLLILGAAIGSVAVSVLISYIVWRITKKDLLPFMLSVVVTLTLGIVAGASIVDNVIESSQEEAHEATLQNIQENYDLVDVQLKPLDNYSEQNKTLVYGAANGTIKEFEVGYSAEYDLMLPVEGIDDPTTIPVREGSALDQVIAEQDDTENM